MSRQINLYNPALGKKKRDLTALMMLQIFAAALLISGMAFGFVEYRLKQQEKAALAITTELAQVQGELAKLKAEAKPRQKSQTLEDAIKAEENEIKSLQTVTQLLERGELGNADGYSKYFTAFARQAVDGLWLTGLSIRAAGNEINLQGRVLQADLVPAYLQKLATEKALQGKVFTALTMQQAENGKANNAGNNADNKAGAAKALDYIEFSLQSAAAKHRPAAGSTTKPAENGLPPEQKPETESKAPVARENPAAEQSRRK